FASTLSLFFFTNPPTTEIYTLSLHDALPIYHKQQLHDLGHADHLRQLRSDRRQQRERHRAYRAGHHIAHLPEGQLARHRARPRRSEEHTSELQSLAYLVCRLLLEKKKKKHTK